MISGVPCRLASSQSSSSLAVKAASVLSGLVEADAEALFEANQVQEVISIDLADSEHYCSPALWKACVYSLADPFSPWRLRLTVISIRSFVRESMVC